MQISRLALAASNDLLATATNATLHS
ncbi:unnamed protein product, partial [Adineta steineri]